MAEEDGFLPEYDGSSQESWENGFRVDLQRGGSCGQVAVVGYREVGGRQRAGTDVSKLRVTSKEPKVKTGSLPRGSERSWGKHSQMEASMVHKTQQLQVGELFNTWPTLSSEGGSTPPVQDRPDVWVQKLVYLS